MLSANGSITVTNNPGDQLLWLTTAGARTLTNTGVQSITVVNTGQPVTPDGFNVLVYLDENGRRTTTAAGNRQSILITNLGTDALLYLDAERNPTTAITGTAFIAGGILVEDRVQERGVQQVGFQQTGHQERGFQERGFQQVDGEDNPLFVAADGSLTTDVTNKPAITVTNDPNDPLLWLNFRGNKTVEITGTQSIDVTGSAADPLLWLDANGKRTTAETGVQSIDITNTVSDAKLWIDANGNLTTTAGNAVSKTAGNVQQRGVHERTSSQQLIYLTENGTETTAVTERPKISVTNNKFDDLLYVNSSGFLTTDAGNKMAIASAATAAQLAAVNNGLATISIWVEDDNDQTTTNTQFKSFTNTPDGKVPGTGTAAPLLWLRCA